MSSTNTFALLDDTDGGSGGQWTDKKSKKHHRRNKNKSKAKTDPEDSAHPPKPKDPQEVKRDEKKARRLEKEEQYQKIPVYPKELLYEETAHDPTRGIKPCSFFPSRRGCSNGEMCAFPHTRVCPYYSSGRCRSGKYCSFLHWNGNTTIYRCVNWFEPPEDGEIVEETDTKPADAEDTGDDGQGQDQGPAKVRLPCQNPVWKQGWRCGYCRNGIPFPKGSGSDYPDPHYYESAVDVVDDDDDGHHVEYQDSGVVYSDEDDY